MIDPDALNVWCEQQLLGYLWRNQHDALAFRYEPAWIAAGGFALSCSLPLRRDDFSAEDGIAHRFFANLLPEGGVRERLVRDLKISDTDYNLLRAVGGECAGALSVMPVSQLPEQQPQYRVITEQELARLCRRGGGLYALLPVDQRPRLSLAGAQDKCPILVKDHGYFLPMREAPSSHILKFELADYGHVPAYETFTTQLAGAVGLPVVDIELRSIGKSHYTLIPRYDRRWDEQGQVQRLHQEDFCQALGYGHNKKYQGDGGPSFAQCYRLVQDTSSQPAVDLPNLLRWQIFNLLAGNSDGHAKNLSLLHRPDGTIRLAPFYDLVCTRAIERIDTHLAFAVGGERNPGQIKAAHWVALAGQCDLKPRYLNKLINETARALLAQFSPTKEAFETRYGAYPALQRIEQIVNKQCRSLAKVAF